MASYFEEHDCEPGAAPEERLPPRRALLELARSLFRGLEIDAGALQGGDWDHRLPPPAARRAVEGLPEVRVSAPQAGGRGSRALGGSGSPAGLPGAEAESRGHLRRSARLTGRAAAAGLTPCCLSALRAQPRGSGAPCACWSSRRRRRRGRCPASTSSTPAAFFPGSERPIPARCAATSCPPTTRSTRSTRRRRLGSSSKCTGWSISMA